VAAAQPGRLAPEPSSRPAAVRTPAGEVAGRAPLPGSRPGRGGLVPAGTDLLLNGSAEAGDASGNGYEPSARDVNGPDGSTVGFDGALADDLDLSLSVPAATPPPLVPPRAEVPRFDHVFLIYLEKRGLPRHRRQPGAGAVGLEGYLQSAEGPCDDTVHQYYWDDDEPMMYFADVRTRPGYCAAHVVPLAQYGIDLRKASSTPSFSWLSPDDCYGVEGCGIAAGDSFTAQVVSELFTSPAWRTQRCLLILTFDEDAEDGQRPANLVPSIVLGSDNVKAGYVSHVRSSHYSLLRTTEAALGLSTLTANDRFAPALKRRLRARGARDLAARADGRRAGPSRRTTSALRAESGPTPWRRRSGRAGRPPSRWPTSAPIRWCRSSSPAGAPGGRCTSPRRPTRSRSRATGGPPGW